MNEPHQIQTSLGGRFHVNQVFRSSEHEIVIAPGSDDHLLLLLNKATGETLYVPVEMFVRAVEEHSVIEVKAGEPIPALITHRAEAKPFSDILGDMPLALRSEAAIGILAQKLRWIKRLRQAGVKSFRPDADLSIVLKEVEHKFEEECPFTLDTLYRAQLRLDKNHDNPRALLPSFHRRGGRGASRLDSEVENMIDMALKQAAKPESGRLRPINVYQAVCAMVVQRNRMDKANPVSFPSLPTVTRRFKSVFSAYDVTARNYGKKRADRLFRENGPRIRAAAPLDVVEFDDTDTTLFLIDDRSGLPWGRSWLTAGVDDFTAGVMGKSLGDKPRSIVTAVEAFMHALMPKNASDPEFELCARPWVEHGHMGTIFLDNALYNQASATEVTLSEFGTEVMFARPHQPTNKSGIEHFNHCLKSDFIPTLPGWSGPKGDREMLKEGMGTAVLDLSTFNKKLNAWILDQYSHKPNHKGITPHEAWSREFRLSPPLMPLRMPSTDLLHCLPETKRFRASGGLLRKGLRYGCPELELLRRHLGHNAEVQIRYNPHDLSYLFVRDPRTGHFIKVHCLEAADYVRGLTDYQQSLILRHCRHRKISHPSLVDLYASRRAIAEEVAKLRFSKKLTERKRGVRQTDAGLEVINVEPTRILTDVRTVAIVESDVEVWSRHLSEDQDEAGKEES